MKNQIINMKTIQDYNNNLGVETLNHLVSVVNMSDLNEIRHSLKRFGFYCIILKQLSCGTLSYGRNKYDYQEGTLVFVAPTQVAGANDGGVTKNPNGWILMFHPDLLKGTSLTRIIHQYSFFSYTSNEALHLSEHEKQIIIGYMQKIREELHNPNDKYNNRIIISNIELLLNHCSRFYDRQFGTRKEVNHDVLTRFEAMIQDYFSNDTSDQKEIPTVAWFANKLCLSPNYFGDLVKRETGISPQEYITQHTVEQIKHLLIDERLTISQAAYKMGYKYPQHLSRMFKRITGITPKEYISQKTLHG